MQKLEDKAEDAVERVLANGAKRGEPAEQRYWTGEWIEMGCWAAGKSKTKKKERKKREKEKKRDKRIKYGLQDGWSRAEKLEFVIHGRYGTATGFGGFFFLFWVPGAWHLTGPNFLILDSLFSSPFDPSIPPTRPVSKKGKGKKVLIKGFVFLLPAFFFRPARVSCYYFVHSK
jgi:hypothetical protein